MRRLIVLVAISISPSFASLSGNPLMAAMALDGKDGNRDNIVADGAYLGGAINF